MIWSGPATLYGQLLTIVLVISGIAGLLLVSMINARHIMRRLDAQRDLDRTDRVALLREALHPDTPHDQMIVLVIEDNESMRSLTTRQLTDAGYEVRAAGSAEEALVSMAHVRPMPDLIVVDMRLPLIDGLEFVRQIRTAGCKMPILGYSAFGGGLGESQKKEAIAAGCNDFVNKGAKDGSGQNELITLIARWLEITANLRRAS